MQLNLACLNEETIQGHSVRWNQLLAAGAGMSALGNHRVDGRHLPPAGGNPQQPPTLAHKDHLNMLMWVKIVPAASLSSRSVAVSLLPIAGLLSPLYSPHAANNA